MNALAHSLVKYRGRVIKDTKRFENLSNFGPNETHWKELAPRLYADAAVLVKSYISALEYCLNILKKPPGYVAEMDDACKKLTKLLREVHGQYADTYEAAF